MVICLQRGADLHMAQLMPLPLTVSCFSKIQRLDLHSAYSESVRRRRVRGGTGRARPVPYDAGPKRPVVDRSTSRSQNDFNLHDFSLTR